jgi:osmoprotectant transport system substrate-binding protein
MRRTLLATVAALTLAAGCGTGKDDPGSTLQGAGDKGSIVVGSFNFGESEIVANMYADVLAKAGFKTSVKKLTNREVVEPALERGDIGLVPEYLSTLTEFLNGKAHGPNAAPLASPDPQRTVTALRGLAQPRGLKVLDPSPAADQNAFAVTKDFATKNRLTTLSDLGGYQGKLVLGGPPECPKRPFCQPGLEKTYGIKFDGFKALDAGGPLTKTAIQKGTVQIGLVLSSDGSLPKFGLQVLQDDKKLQNADVVTPVANAKALKPGMQAPLDKLSRTLTTDDLVALNKKVDIEHQDPAKVAREWLRSKGLV